VIVFEDLRRERQPMRVIAERLSFEWYIRYDLHESLRGHYVVDGGKAQMILDMLVTAVELTANFPRTVVAF